MKTLITNSKPYKNYGYEMEQFERENNVIITRAYHEPTKQGYDLVVHYMEVK
ncbi:hypothetical protein [Staphylococcus phage vB_SauM-V1SA22]|nr:hypothetical protein [Staphylococcus phage vB_SauM-V1SA22]